jgi:hypothetical protein
VIELRLHPGARFAVFCQKANGVLFIARFMERNQAEVLDAMRREALSGAEVKGVVDLWLSCADRAQQQYVLAHPREALSAAAFLPPKRYERR